ncbi:MAG TPA: hypothetical protein VK517_02705 [Cyclobacteriaceae bacterium]|jgi:hypothetical protein|nr:hypothetical protein [Cyclobacteriaceae bacterium]
MHWVAVPHVLLEERVIEKLISVRFVEKLYLVGVKAIATMVPLGSFNVKVVEELPPRVVSRMWGSGPTVKGMLPVLQSEYH